jgi:hypothetical protein
MRLHSKAITKPQSADVNDVQDTLDLFAFINSLLELFDTFFANSPKTQTGS